MGPGKSYENHVQSCVKPSVTVLPFRPLALIYIKQIQCDKDIQAQAIDLIRRRSHIDSEAMLQDPTRIREDMSELHLPAFASKAQGRLRHPQATY